MSERDLLASKELEAQDLSEHTYSVIRQKFSLMTKDKIKGVDISTPIRIKFIRYIIFYIVYQRLSYLQVYLQDMYVLVGR